MDIIFFCISTATGFVIGYFFESIFDLLAHSSPLNVVLVYHFILSFILVALYFARQAFIRRPGRLCWHHRFHSIEEAFEFIKLAVFWWLILFNFAVGMEVFAFGIYALPFILDWRQDHCDDPEYLPLLMRLNWANISWMGGLIGEMERLMLWHIQNYWAELRDYLEQLLQRRSTKGERQICISSFALIKNQIANLKNGSR